ncbi:MAG TPA: DUF6062 family protein [Chloroflexia bacterium]|nr:DUF6062 family protein [Chloroflexia bacterium]
MVGQNQTYYEIKERFELAAGQPEKAACPLCQLTRESVARYMGSLSYENVNDPEQRERLRASGGFCNRHSWQWHSHKDALGTAIIYQDVARVFLSKLAEGNLATTLSPVRSGLWSFFSGGVTEKTGGSGQNNHELGAPGIEKREELKLARCPACELEDANGQRLVEEFVHGLKEEGFREAYTASKGICLPHLAWAEERMNTTTRQLVLKVEAEKWAEIQNELGQVIEKSNFDHHLGQQKLGPEAYAIYRSLWKASGMEGLG